MGKRILITHCWLTGFGGAELNILQLAQYLKENGYEVTVFTYWHEGEMVEEFKKLNIKVIVDRFHYLDTKDNFAYSEINIKDYDFIWVCQQVVPISIVRQLNKRSSIKFIFLHMSSLMGIPVEAPIIYGLEESIASKILVISEETLNDNVGRIIDKDDPRIEFYRNPVPVQFSRISKKVTKLRKIAVITNHPADELLDMEKIVGAEGVSIDYIGSWNNNYQLVDAHTLQKYDLVVGIGKNVQYCLVAGIPVYVYDYFGGPGFLDANNYKKARHYSFSGRGFEKKNSREIAEDILTNYTEALNFYNQRRGQWIDEYSIDKVVPNILDNMPSCQSSRLDDRYLNYVVSMQVLLHDRFMGWGANNNNNKTIKQLESKLVNKDKELEGLHKVLASRKQLIKRLIKRSL